MVVPMYGSLGLEVGLEGFSCELILACGGFVGCLNQLMVIWWSLRVISDGCMSEWDSRLWWFCNGIEVSDFKRCESLGWQCG